MRKTNLITLLQALRKLCPGFQPHRTTAFLHTAGLSAIFLSLTFSLAAEKNQDLFVQQITFNDSVSRDMTAVQYVLGRIKIISVPSTQRLDVEIASWQTMPDTIEYRLITGDEKVAWVSTSSNVINLCELSEKKYRLFFRGKGFTGNEQHFEFLIGDAKAETLRDKWWFQPIITFCLLLIPFTILYFLSLDRSRRNLRLEEVRNQIASDLHDAVGANLGAIKNLAELLQKRHEQQDAKGRATLIEKINSYTKDTISNLQDTVWSINPLNDSVEELLERMREFALLMFSTREMVVNYDNDYRKQNPIKLDMEQRHGMFMMFKETVNNIMKYAEATQVDIQVRNQERSKLLIQIKDNGKGFNLKEVSKGNGLRNLRARAKENFFDLDIQSAPGNGTQVTMVIHSLV